VEQLGKYTIRSVVGSRNLKPTKYKTYQGKMHKMHKRNNILKNSCKGIKKVAILEWKNCISIKYK
jgi:hypothetical protein